MTELNDKLQPIDSLPAQRIKRISALEFESQFDRSAITTSKIKDRSITNAKLDSFTFNKGVGGTITLGGTANGNGIMQIKNASGNTIIQGDKDGHHYYDTGGTEKVTLNSSGLTVNDGKITINNSSGSSVLDATGLVSASSFPTTTNIVQSTQTTTSTSYTPLANGTLSSMTATRETVLLMYITYDAYNVGFIYDGYGGNIRAYDTSTGAEVTFTASTFRGIFSPDETFSTIQVATQRVTTVVPTVVAAGAHEFRLEYKALGGGTATVTEFVFGYLQLGN